MGIPQIADNITRWCVIVIATLLPIFVVPLPWISAPQAKLLLIAGFSLVALVAWLVARLFEGYLVIPRNLLLLTGALLPIAYGISAFVTGGTWTSLIGTTVAQDTVVIVCIWYALLLIVALAFPDKGGAMRKLLQGFLLGSLVLVVFQILRLFKPDLLSLGGYLSGSSSSIFGTWHDLGIIAGLLLFLAIALWDTSIVQNAFWKVVLVLLGLGSLVLLVIINTIDVWYAVAILSLVYGMYRIIEEMRGGAGMNAAIVGAVLWLIVAAGAGAAGHWSSKIYDRLPTKLQIVQLEVRPSWMGTYLIGQKALSGGKQLVFGSGPNTFTREWGLFKPAGVNQTDFWNVDFNSGVGFIPTTFVTTGIVGLAAWTLFLLAFLWSIVKLFTTSQEPIIRRVHAAILAAALYIVAFQVIYVPGIALSALLFLFAGMVITLELAGREWEPILVGLRAVSVAGIVRIIVVVVALGLVSLAPLTALRATSSDLFVQRAAAVYAKTGKLDDSRALVQQALKIFPQNDIAHRAAVEVGLLQLSQLMQSGKNDDAAKKQLESDLQVTIAHGLSAVSIDGADYQNWLELASLYQNLSGVGIQGAYQNAKDAYLRTIGENPTNPLAHVRLAQLAIDQKDLNFALDHLNTAIKLKPNFAAAYYLRSQVLATEGSFAPAIEDAGAAAQLTPQDPVGWYNLGTILYSAQSYDLASQALGRAVSLQNNYSNAMFMLALSWDKLGKHADALAAMQAVQKLNSTDATVAQIIANLEAGRGALESTPPAPAPTKTAPKKTGR